MELRSLLGWNVHTAEAINAQAWAKGPALVTTVYLALYYVLLFSQSFTKLYLFQQAKAKQDDAPSLSSIKYFSQDKRALRADRVVGNTLEQMGPFLVSLWLHAWAVDSTVATALGAVYIAFRVLYAVVFTRVGYKTVLVVVTTPAYLIIWYMLIMVVWQLWST